MRTHNLHFLTLLILPHNVGRDNVIMNLTDTPSFRAIVEGTPVRGLRADQIIIVSGCDTQSNQMKPWFDELKTSLVPHGRIIFL